MYLIPTGEDLNVDRLGKILMKFQGTELPNLNKKFKYYQGKLAIMNKRPSDAGKPCNKIVANYCFSITKNYLGYITGVPIQYNNETVEFDEIMDVLKYNDFQDEDTEYLRLALIYGRSFEINYVDEDGKQRFRVLDARECVPIYYNNLNNDLAFVVRFYREDMVDNTENYIVEVYGTKDVKIYKSGAGFTSFSLIDERPHYFNQVPVTVFSLNKDEEGIFEQIIKLQDAYNSTLSNALDSDDALADAYLLFKGVTADEEDLKDAKSKRAFMVDTDADVSYLTKNINDTATQNLLKNINDQIHTISNSPDFNDEKFMAQSGIAMRFKLVGFENTAAAIEAQMRKALTKRIELITSVLSMVNGEQTWRDVNIVFTRNLPISLDPTSVSELLMYKGLVSDETLLKQVPFVESVEEEMAKLKAQKEANIEAYGFGITRNAAGEEMTDEEEE